MAAVQAPPPEDLGHFVSGRLRGQQRFLWRLYSFDVVPLEFISSIYEEFVTAKGSHYTPGYWSTSCSTKCCLGETISGTLRSSIRLVARASFW